MNENNTKDRRILKGEIPEALRDMENEYGLKHVQENDQHN